PPLREVHCLGRGAGPEVEDATAAEVVLLECSLDVRVQGRRVPRERRDFGGRVELFPVSRGPHRSRWTGHAPVSARVGYVLLPTEDALDRPMVIYVLLAGLGILS